MDINISVKEYDIQELRELLKRIRSLNVNLVREDMRLWGINFAFSAEGSDVFDFEDMTRDTFNFIIEPLYEFLSKLEGKTQLKIIELEREGH